ncbi:hypothetical protein FZEAL_6180 [Fusarium zealandicum]|uniref:tRNA-intron lyase n=1 Tax=Fusarium zealandicum TaxID=1053134 RepID=A0A8H4UIH0_9HYPO|nr:hypothetical protein FZEAL_6180 [Fusarium zealandicum]
MAEIQSSTPAPVGTPPSEPTGPRQPQQRGPSLHQIYALPAPIRTFPLPVFYPNNPISFFHVAYAWLGQLWSPPPAEPAVVHQGVWSPATSSVHITDEAATRAFWEQGFYGKGSLSRSEPNWLKREQVRKGLADAHVSEILTVQRREERMRVKWERARLEQEVIRQTRHDEAREAEAREAREAEAQGGRAREAKEQESKALASPVTSHPEPVKPTAPHVTLPSVLPPVSPAALLALPNSSVDLAEFHNSSNKPLVDELPTTTESVNGVGTLLDPSATDTASGTLANSDEINQEASTSPEEQTLVLESIELDSVKSTADGQISLDVDVSSPSMDGLYDTTTLKRRKSVRFSPTVESTTFQLGDPPSPNHSAANGKTNGLADINAASLVNLNGHASADEGGAVAPSHKSVLKNMEHLQLMPEEAFFLSFGLGALTVTDPASGEALSSVDLLTLFRQYSYFPPRNEPDDPALQPDDKFLVHYAVYHHFRSLGWVPRGGIKFGVDWLLYTRGPVFDHAEFGLIVVPSYSDSLWKENGNVNPQKTWQWLHGTVRVLSHVTKSLVLVYVDVPPPSKFEEALDKGVAEALKLYKVREVMVKRWSSNRNR